MAEISINTLADRTASGDPLLPETGLVLYIWNPNLNGGADILLVESTPYSGRYAKSGIDAGSYQLYQNAGHATGTRLSRFEPINAEQVSAEGILDDTITADQIANNAIGNDELGANAVESGNIKNNDVTPEDLSDSLVTLPSDPLTIGVAGNFIGQIGTYGGEYYVCISKTVIPLWAKCVADGSVVPTSMANQTATVTSVRS